MADRTFPIQVDLDDAMPIYAQVERQMRVLLARGYWKPGDQLPSVRELAVRLGINPLTVVKVYRRLRDEGVVVSRPGAGIFVSDRPVARGKERLRRVREAFGSAVEQAVGLGLEEEAIRELVDEALSAVRQKANR